MKEMAQSKPYEIDTRVLDATDMSVLADESFDVVRNMGPFYHLVNESDRNPISFVWFGTSGAISLPDILNHSFRQASF